MNWDELGQGRVVSGAEAGWAVAKLGWRLGQTGPTGSTGRDWEGQQPRGGGGWGYWEGLGGTGRDWEGCGGGCGDAAELWGRADGCGETP